MWASLPQMQQELLEEALQVYLLHQGMA